ncbi:uncharacterized protein LOC130988280 [Salvia miltiorrhiza]|uniref:uncharacterized protein LOC130988280 n=1 Tax=Salvia miltiorrhiza TaxID=226208 RepID=UPI0025ACDAED|nr:uncharacterized protein LOC130988280 [Salvia miltiorrhiza]
MEKPEHFDDYGDLEEYLYIKSLNLSCPYIHFNGPSTKKPADIVADDDGTTDDGKPPPHVLRQQHVADTNIKCFLCQSLTQTAGEHQISVYPCGLVFGYSCINGALTTGNETCPGCGQQHVGWEVTKLDISPDQIIK